MFNKLPNNRSEARASGLDFFYPAPYKTCEHDLPAHISGMCSKCRVENLRKAGKRDYALESAIDFFARLKFFAESGRGSEPVAPTKNLAQTFGLGFYGGTSNDKDVTHRGGHNPRWRVSDDVCELCEQREAQAKAEKQEQARAKQAEIIRRDERNKRNRAKAQETTRAWKKDNPEAVSEHNTAYYLRHKDQIRQSKKDKYCPEKRRQQYEAKKLKQAQSTTPPSE